MGAARDPAELRDVPAVAVCATCGDPSCPGHDFEMSGERPIRRTLPWEDGATPPMRALWRTAMTTASDLDLWVKSSVHDVNGIGPAFTFALACECVAVASTCIPLGAIGALLAWNWTHSFSAIRTILALTVRVAAVFIPLMICIHVVHQWALARAGGKLGLKASRSSTLRAGLYACGWDLATGPAGVLASAFSGAWREAQKRVRGNSTLFRDATREWLRSVHEVEGARAEQARRATLPWMTALLLLTVALTGWAFVASIQ